MAPLLRSRFLPPAIFAAALTLRLLHLADLSSLPVFDHPVMDQHYHDEWARHVAGGDFEAQRVFFRAPLYPYVLGLVYALAGPSVAVARVVQSLTGAITCLLVASLAERIFASRLAFALGGSLAAASWTLIYFDGELLVEPLFILLTLAAIRLTLIARERPAPAFGAAAGFLFGLAAITRPTILPFTPVALAHIAMPAPRRRARSAAAFACALAAGVAPVTLHNLVRGGDFVLIASQGGVNFYIGNNPLSDGKTAVVPRTRPTWEGGYADTIRIAEAAAGRPLRPSEVSRYWYGKAWDFILGSPLEALSLTVRKAVLFWNAFEIGNNEDFDDLRARCRLISLPLPGFAAIAPLGLAGALLALAAPGPGGRAAAALLAAFIAVQSGVTVAFFVNTRYRLPALAALAVFAGGALAACVEALRAPAGEAGKAARRRGVLAAVTSAALAPLIALNWYGLRPNPGVGEHLMGIAYAQAGEPERALDEFQSAAGRPRNPLAYASLTESARILMSLGRSAEAESALGRAVDLAPGDPDARVDLAGALFRKGDLGGARAQMAAALQAQDGSWEDADARYRLGLICQAQGDTEAAQLAYRRALALDPSHPESATNLALILEQRGRTGEALRLLKQAVIAAPRLAPARYALARVLLRAGDAAAAREEARRAESLGAVLDPGFVAALEAGAAPRDP